MARKYRHVYRTMLEDTSTGDRHGKYGSIRYNSAKKGRRKKTGGKRK